MRLVGFKGGSNGVFSVSESGYFTGVELAGHFGVKPKTIAMHPISRQCLS